MGKEAYYFSHDSNAQDDPKCMLLIDQLGMEGYGIFWGLIERLRNEPDYKLPLFMLPSLAKRWGTSAEKVQTVVSKFGLFIFEDEKFFSARLLRSMQEKSDRGRKNALNRWKNDENATAMQLQCNSNATAMQNDANKGKESKVKKKKGNETKSDPTQEETEESNQSITTKPVQPTNIERFRQSSTDQEAVYKFAKSIGKLTNFADLQQHVEIHDAGIAITKPEADYKTWMAYFRYYFENMKVNGKKQTIAEPEQEPRYFKKIKFDETGRPIND